MEKWTGKIAVVTGASSGIGEATTKLLVKNGMKVVALSRNEDKINRMMMLGKGKIHAIKCDVKNEKSILAAFRRIEELFGGVDVLVNNAGFITQSDLKDGSTNIWKDILDTNTMGLSICTREALKSMRKRGDKGHIINVNSIAGRSVDFDIDYSLGMYPPSKYAVTAITQILRQELRAAGSQIRVTSINPGAVYTKMLVRESYDDEIQKIPKGILSADDVAETIVIALSFESNVEVQELTVQSSQPLDLSSFATPRK